MSPGWEKVNSTGGRPLGATPERLHEPPPPNREDVWRAYAQALEEAAKLVVWFDWRAAGNDEDACQTVDDLRNALKGRPS